MKAWVSTAVVMLLMSFAVWFVSDEIGLRRPLNASEWALVEAEWNPKPLHETRGLAETRWTLPVAADSGSLILNGDVVAILAGVVTVLGGLYWIITKLVVGPMLTQSRAMIDANITNRFETLIQQFEKTFSRKPEMQDDYPVTRREFAFHKEQDADLHREMDAQFERYHMRFRAVEASVTDLEINKEDRSSRLPRRTDNP